MYHQTPPSPYGSDVELYARARMAGDVDADVRQVLAAVNQQAQADANGADTRAQVPRLAWWLGVALIVAFSVNLWEGSRT